MASGLSTKPEEDHRGRRIPNGASRGGSVKLSVTVRAPLEPEYNSAALKETDKNDDGHRNDFTAVCQEQSSTSLDRITD